ncbi:MAG: hypothetical protein JW892_06450 [Anaerolineae bacterium]|nr:hypothetical protein [Anaerolineae bacterium]
MRCDCAINGLLRNLGTNALLSLQMVRKGHSTVSVSDLLRKPYTTDYWGKPEEVL